MKNILIVGASSSIGNTIIKKFHSATTNIVATYNSKNCIESGENIYPMFLDLTDDKSIKNFVVRLVKVFQHIDIGIFLPSIVLGKSLDEYGSNDIDIVMSVNFSGQAKILTQIQSKFIDGSQIIYFSSISAQKGSYDPIYAASKGAILSFVKSLASELPKGVRINAIAPGLIENSSMYNIMGKERQDFHRKQVPSNKLLQIEDLANVIYDLTKEHWSHLNGACIDLNGGRYVR